MPTTSGSPPPPPDWNGAIPHIAAIRPGIGLEPGAMPSPRLRSRCCSADSGGVGMPRPQPARLIRAIAAPARTRAATGSSTTRSRAAGSSRFAALLLAAAEACAPAGVLAAGLFLCLWA